MHSATWLPWHNIFLTYCIKPFVMKNTDPIKKPQDIKQSNDNKIDDDFNNYPDAPSRKEEMGKSNVDKNDDANGGTLNSNEAVPMEDDGGATPTNNLPKAVQDNLFTGGHAADRKPAAYTGNNEQLSIDRDEADLTQDDYIALGDKDKDMDDGEDEIARDGSANAFEATERLEETVSDLDDDTLSRHESETGGDLDVPGSEMDDENEDIGEEDEENNYYSLSGDNKY